MSKSRYSSYDLPSESTDAPKYLAKKRTHKTKRANGKNAAAERGREHTAARERTGGKKRRASGASKRKEVQMSSCRAAAAAAAAAERASEAKVAVARVERDESHAIPWLS